MEDESSAFMRGYWRREWQEMLAQLDHGGPYDEAIRQTAKAAAEVRVGDPLGFLSLSTFGARESLVRQFAWAIPNRATIAALTKLSPLVETGAGTGYWAKLLRDAGADVIAYDACPPPNTLNAWHSEIDGSKGAARLWSPVEVGTTNALASHSDRTLFLCWPPYAHPMASESLAAWKGKTLAVIGEGNGGCTADDMFWDGLEKAGFEEVEVVSIPQWSGVHDALFVWRRA